MLSHFEGCETISFLKAYGDESMINVNHLGDPEYYFDEHIYPSYLDKGKELVFFGFFLSSFGKRCPEFIGVTMKGPCYNQRSSFVGKYHSEN